MKESGIELKKTFVPLLSSSTFLGLYFKILSTAKIWIIQDFFFCISSHLPKYVSEYSENIQHVLLLDTMNYSSFFVKSCPSPLSTYVRKCLVTVLWKKAIFFWLFTQSVISHDMPTFVVGARSHLSATPKGKWKIIWLCDARISRL